MTNDMTTIDPWGDDEVTILEVFNDITNGNFSDVGEKIESYGATEFFEAFRLFLQSETRMTTVMRYSTYARAAIEYARYIEDVS